MCVYWSEVQGGMEAGLATSACVRHAPSPTCLWHMPLSAAACTPADVATFRIRPDGPQDQHMTHHLTPCHILTPRRDPQVYDRMGHEINESPRLKEHVWRQGQAAAKAKVAAKESKELMRELDNFEDHLSHVQRMRARSQYAAPEDA